MSLGHALPQEQARVRALKELYLGLPGGVGRPAAFLMERSLAAADMAATSGDVVAMLTAYQDLQGFTD